MPPKQELPVTGIFSFGRHRKRTLSCLVSRLTRRKPLQLVFIIFALVHTVEAYLNLWFGPVSHLLWRTPQRCPACGGTHLIGHGTRRRRYQDCPLRECPVDENGHHKRPSILVQRLNCKDCNHTSTVLPVWLKPHALYVQSIRERVVLAHLDGRSLSSQAKEMGLYGTYLLRAWTKSATERIDTVTAWLRRKLLQDRPEIDPPSAALLSSEEYLLCLLRAWGVAAVNGRIFAEANYLLSVARCSGEKDALPAFL